MSLAICLMMAFIIQSRVAPNRLPLHKLLPLQINMHGQFCADDSKLYHTHFSEQVGQPAGGPGGQIPNSQRPGQAGQAQGSGQYVPAPGQNPSQPQYGNPTQASPYNPRPSASSPYGAPPTAQAPFGAGQIGQQGGQFGAGPPGQSNQYPGQSNQYPGQGSQYPGQANQYPGQNNQYPGQGQQNSYGQPQQPGNYGHQGSFGQQGPNAGFGGPQGQIHRLFITGTINTNPQ